MLLSYTRLTTVTLLFIFCLSLLQTAVAQNQAHIWYFGDHAGIDFRYGTPSALTDGQTKLYMGHNEGSAVISDSKGNLLFYTDGTTIWNRNHQVMSNGSGLLGNASSTQSSIIVPDPANPHRYFYVFTVGSGFCCNGSIHDGLRYSKVDMCGDNKNGEVMSAQKNVLLLDSVAEKVAVAVDYNNKDYWVLTHKFFSNQFVAFHLTADGVSKTVMSAVGSFHGNDIAGSQGQLKFAPDGMRVAIAANNSDPILEVFDFDLLTGIVSNPIVLTRPNNNWSGVYGVEFSSDGSKLYAHALTNQGLLRSVLVQYNLGAGSVASINASIYEIFNYSSGLMRGIGLQIGTDGKIYAVSAQNPGWLSVINNPKDYHANCNFQDQQVYLGGRQGSYSLPSFIAGFHYNNSLTNCEGNWPVVDPCIILPNPVSKYAHYFFENLNSETYTIRIYNSIGQLVQVIDHLNSSSAEIYSGGLARGVYFIVLWKGQTVVRKCKFLVH